MLSKLDQTAAEVLPRVHLIFSLLKRWILGTHQGSVSLKHLDGYLEEFTFRLYGALDVKLRMWMPYSFLCQRLDGGRLAARCTTV